MCNFVFRSEVMVETIKRTVLNGNPNAEVISGILTAAMNDYTMRTIKVTIVVAIINYNVYSPSFII